MVLGESMSSHVTDSDQKATTKRVLGEVYPTANAGESLPLKIFEISQ